MRAVSELQKFLYRKNCWYSPKRGRNHQCGAIMRRLCLCFSFLLAALVVAPNATAQDTLKLNQTYRDVIQLDFPAGKTQIPLPEGEWELLGLQEDLADVGIRMWLVYLARVENDTLVGQIIFYINSDLYDGGWASVPGCKNSKFYYEEIISNEDSNVDCWNVWHIRLRLKNSWPDGRKQMHNTLLARNITIPRSMMRIVFIRRNEDNLLSLTYYFHPYPPGSASVTPDDIKTWGRKWKPKVDAGFLGKLKMFKTKETLAPPGQTPKTVTSGEEKGDIEQRIIRLLKLYDEGLISDSEYFQKRNRILLGL